MELNKKVIIRADRAGVFYGTIIRIKSTCKVPWQWLLRSRSGCNRMVNQGRVF